MRTWHVTLTMAVILAGTIALGAQGGSADDRELAQYRLTVDGVAKAAAVAQAYVADPAIKKWQDAAREAEALENKDDLTPAEEKKLEQLQAVADKPPYNIDIEAQTLTAMAAAYTKVPPIASALAKAGLPPRDFAKFVMVVTQAAIVQAVQKQGMKIPLPAGVSPENMAFVGAHEAEIERLIKLMGVPEK